MTYEIFVVNNWSKCFTGRTYQTRTEDKERQKSRKHEAQEKSGGDQSPPTAGAAGRVVVPSPMVKAWLHEGRVMFPRNLESAAASKSYDGSMIVGRGFIGGLTQPTPGIAGRNPVPTSSEQSDGDNGRRACSSRDSQYPMESIAVLERSSSS